MSPLVRTRSVHDSTLNAAVLSLPKAILQSLCLALEIQVSLWLAQENGHTFLPKNSSILLTTSQSRTGSFSTYLLRSQEVLLDWLLS